MFVYRYCPQISEYNLLKIATLCLEINYIDGRGSGKVSYASALAILCTCNKLATIAVVPKAGENNVWGKLIFQFSAVSFAQCIKQAVEHKGSVDELATKCQCWLKY